MTYFPASRFDGGVTPLWFSLVRDPVKKFESRYYFARFEKESFARAAAFRVSM